MALSHRQRGILNFLMILTTAPVQADCFISPRWTTSKLAHYCCWASPHEEQFFSGIFAFFTNSCVFSPPHPPTHTQFFFNFFYHTLFSLFHTYIHPFGFFKTFLPTISTRPVPPSIRARLTPLVEVGTWSKVAMSQLRQDQKQHQTFNKSMSWRCPL